MDLTRVNCNWSYDQNNCGSFINTLDKISSSFCLLNISKLSLTSLEEYFAGREKVLGIGHVMNLSILIGYLDMESTHYLTVKV